MTIAEVDGARTRSAAPARSQNQPVAPFRYAVIDLAVAEDLRNDVVTLLPSFGETLFDRRMDPRLLMVAPWLIRLSRAPVVEAKLAALDAILPWGYYVHSTVDIASLRRALRRFNLARIPDKKDEVLFRYWDPRVMRIFLEIATRFQRDRLFEVIDRIEAPDGSFSVTSGKAA